MRRYKVGVDRDQAALFPARLDDYVAEGNPVRAIEAYVESLDLRDLGYTRTGENAHLSGQPAYSPQTLLKLYMYGYVNRIRSSRMLQRECERNVEVMWLLQGLRPSYKTIADFRRANGEALRRTNRDFVLLCRELGLLGGERVAIDGSFFKGDVGASSVLTERGLQAEVGRLEGQIERWLGELDEADERGVEDPPAGEDDALREKLQALRARRQVAQEELEALRASGEGQRSKVDADARLLRKRDQKVRGYNVQIAVDEKHSLVVAGEVTRDSNDLHQLHPMASEAKAVLGVERLAVLADVGYYHGGQIQACEAQAITPYVAVVDRRSGKAGRFGSEDFAYDAARDLFTCPGGQRLLAKGEPRMANGRLEQRYSSRSVHCRACALRDRCVPPKGRVREVWRNEWQETLRAHEARMRAAAHSMRDRACLAEHPFGTLKTRAGWRHFLVRSLPKVSGEFSLMVLTYNLTRVLNLVDVERFRAYCASRRGHRVMGGAAPA